MDIGQLLSAWEAMQTHEVAIPQRLHAPHINEPLLTESVSKAPLTQSRESRYDPSIERLNADNQRQEREYKEPDGTAVYGSPESTNTPLDEEPIFAAENAPQEYIADKKADIKRDQLPPNGNNGYLLKENAWDSI